ncbi:MAG: WG repeat-containing protein [Oscillospiraceae bacterium]|nr:WG repeat-containing protein [Oscillospiraceae bacterium]
MFAVTVRARSDITVKEITSGLGYESIGNFSEGLAIVWQNNKSGFIDKTGKLVVPCVYDKAESFIGGIARVEIGGKCNYIGESGKFLITVEYDEVGDFSDGMAWIRKGEKYGYIDKTGELVIPMIYDFYNNEWMNVCDFAEGLAAVSIEGKCGFIDKTGELVIPAIYDGDFWGGEWARYFPKFDDGIVRVTKDGNAGCIDKTGKVVIAFEYDWLGNSWTGFFCEGLGRIYKYDEDGNRKTGFIDKNGNVVVPLGYYDMISDFNGTLAYVEIYNQGGAYIDKTGKLVTPFGYYADQWSEHFYAPAFEGMTIALQKDGGFVFLDEKGSVIGPYSEINPFSYGLAYVNSENIHGFIDKKGNLIIPTGDYDSVRKFYDGLSCVTKDNKSGYIDTNGEFVVPLIYDSVMDFNEGLAVGQKDGKWVILEIADYSLADISPETGNYFGVLFVLVYTVILAIGSIVYRYKTVSRR